MNWTAIIIVGILALVFIVFLILKNIKDKKEFEKEINNDFPKSKNEEGDIEIEDTGKMH